MFRPKSLFKECDDPFHNNYSSAILESPCEYQQSKQQTTLSIPISGMGGRKGRDGLFPATSCIKIAGHFGKIFLQHFSSF